MTWAMGLAVFTAMAVLIHVQINYDPPLRDIVRPKALISTILVTIPLAFFFFMQMYRNQLLTEELQRLVNRDRLTDVATRDFFFARMEAAPLAYGISLMVDIDHFKQINDTYGHQAGDLVISKVAQCLQRHTRVEDIVCRYGGEEFVIFLFDQGRDDGVALAERMRHEVSQMPVEYEGMRLSVTVSIGGSLKDSLADITAAIREADAALYEAKTGGRNRVIFAPGGSPSLAEAS